MEFWVCGGSSPNRITVEGEGMPAHVIKIKVFVDADSIVCKTSLDGVHAMDGMRLKPNAME